MKPRHSAEQSTTTVNKAEALGKRGFAVLRDKVQAQPTTVEVSAPQVGATFAIAGEQPSVTVLSNITIEEKVEVKTSQPQMKIHLPEDPQDALLCEGCQ